MKGRSQGSPTLDRYLKDSYEVIRYVHDNLPILQRIAGRLTPVEDLVEFKSQVEHLYAHLAVLVEASQIILQISDAGFDMMTAPDVPAQRALLGLGTAALRNEEYFAKASEFLSLVQEVADNLERLIQNEQETDRAHTRVDALEDQLPTLFGLIGDLQNQLNALADSLPDLLKDFATRDELEALKNFLQDLISDVRDELIELSDTFDGKLTVLDDSVTLRISNAMDAVIDGDVFTGFAEAVSELYARVFEVEGGLVSEAGRITHLESEIVNLDGSIQGVATAYDGLTTEVSLIDGRLRATAQDVTDLNVSITDLDHDIHGSGGALDLLRTTVTQQGEDITVESERLTRLSADVTGLDGTVSANADSLASLTSTVSKIGNDIEVVSLDTVQLQSRLDLVDDELVAEATAREDLETRVEQSEDGLLIQGENITEVRAALTGPGNLLPNSSFESEPLGWFVRQRGSGWITVDVTQNLDAETKLPEEVGALGVSVSGVPSGELGISSPRTPVEPNKSYILSGYLAAENCTVSLEWRALNADGDTIEFGVAGEVINEGGGKSLADWPRVHARIDASHDVVLIEAQLWVRDANTATPKAWLVRPMLEEASLLQEDPSPWVPSASGLDVKYAQATEVLRASLEVVGDEVTGIAERLTTLEVEVGDGVAEAIQDLTAQVSENKDGIEANAGSVTKLTSRLGASTEWEIFIDEDAPQNSYLRLASEDENSLVFQRGVTLLHFNTSGELTLSNHFDTFSGAGQRTQLISALDSLGDEDYFVLVGQPNLGSKPEDLVEAFLRVGAHRFGAIVPSRAYVLLGRGGIGPGGGVEYFSRNDEDSLRVFFTLVRDAPKEIGGFSAAADALSEMTTSVEQNKDGITAVSQSVNLLGVETPDGQGFILNESRVRVTPEESLAEWRTSLETEFEDANARIDAEEIARADEDGALAGRIDTIDLDVKGNTAGIKEVREIAISASSGNKVVDPSFETYENWDWAGAPNAVRAVPTDGVSMRSGVAYARFNANPGGTQTVNNYNYFPVEDGIPLNIGYHYRRVGTGGVPNGSIMVAVWWSSEPGGVGFIGSGVYASNGGADFAGGWSPAVSEVVTPPPGARWARIGVRTTHTTGAAWAVDDVFVEPVSESITMHGELLDAMQLDLDGKATVDFVDQVKGQVEEYADGKVEASLEAIRELKVDVDGNTGRIDTAQQAAQDASNLAGSKGKVFFQNNEPPVSERLPQNLWIDRTGGANTPKRWAGNGWFAVTDKVATDAAAAAAAALSHSQTVNARVTTVENASVDRDTALANRTVALEAGMKQSSLIINGSFEDDDLGWTLAANTEVVATTDARHGGKVLRFDGSGAVSSKTIFEASEGDAVDLRAYVRSFAAVPNNGTLIRIVVRWGQADGTLIVNAAAPESYTHDGAGSFQWTELGGVVVAPAGTARGWVIIWVSGMNTGHVIVDEVMAEFIPRTVSNLQATVTTNESASMNRDSAMASRVGVVEARMADIATVDDPSFESGGEGWNLPAGVNVMNPAGQLAHGGSAALRVYSNDGTTYNIQNRRVFPVGQGEKIIASVKTRSHYSNPPNAGAYVQIVLREYGPDMTWLRDSEIARYNYTGSNVFYPAGPKGSHIAGSTTSFGRIALWVRNYTSGGPLYFDEVMVNVGNVADIAANVTVVEDAVATLDTALGQRITTVEGRLPTGGGNAASATALNTLTGQVNTQGGLIQTNASDISQVRTDIGEQSASITELSRVTATVTDSGGSILDPSFERDDGWGERPGNTFGLNPKPLPTDTVYQTNASSSAYAYSGKRSLRFNASASQRDVANNTCFTVIPGKRYLVSYRVRNWQAVGTSANVRAVLTRWDSNRSFIAYSSAGTSLTHTFTSSTDWVRKEGIYTVPEEDGYHMWGLQCRSHTSGGAILVDDFHVELLDDTAEAFRATHSVMLDVNGNVSGTVSENDGQRSTFSIMANVFRVLSPSSTEGMEWKDGYLRVYGSGFQRIIGTDFGVSSHNLVDYFGPNVGAAAASKANATMWMDKTGNAYWGGSLSAGVRRNGGQSTQISNRATVGTGLFGTNGNQKVVTVSLSYYNAGMTTQASERPTAGNTTAVVVVERRRGGSGSWVQITSFTASGVIEHIPEPGGFIVQVSVGGATTYTDAATGTQDFEYRARITSHTGSWPWINPVGDSGTQNLSLLSIEQ